MSILQRLYSAKPTVLLIFLLMICIITFCTTGCAKPLFPHNADMTQFDQYDRMRGYYVPEYEVDPYGRTRPALRARLSKRNY